MSPRLLLYAQEWGLSIEFIPRGRPSRWPLPFYCRAAFYQRILLETICPAIERGPGWVSYQMGAGCFLPNGQRRFTTKWAAPDRYKKRIEGKQGRAISYQRGRHCPLPLLDFR